MRYDWLSALKGFALLGIILCTGACASLGEKDSGTVKNRQLQCLAEAIHGEARGESEEGKIFVGRVIITRVKEGYGQNYCSVVYAKRQFAPLKTPTKQSVAAAKKSEKLGPNGVTHFHSYKNQKTALAGFSRSPACTSKGKIGGHWGFTCGARSHTNQALRSASNTGD